MCTESVDVACSWEVIRGQQGLANVTFRSKEPYLSGPILRTKDERFDPQMQERLLVKVTNENESEPFERPLELRIVLADVSNVLRCTNLFLIHHDTRIAERLGAGGCRFGYLSRHQSWSRNALIGLQLVLRLIGLAVKINGLVDDRRDEHDVPVGSTENNRQRRDFDARGVVSFRCPTIKGEGQIQVIEKANAFCRLSHSREGHPNMAHAHSEDTLRSISFRAHLYQPQSLPAAK